MARTTDKLKSFESNYEKLEELVRKLDAPDLTLKQSLDLYEKAVKLSQSCEGALEYARQKAQALDVRTEKESADEGPSEGVLDL